MSNGIRTSDLWVIFARTFPGVIELQGRVVINANGRNSCPCTCCQSGCAKTLDLPVNPGPSVAAPAPAAPAPAPEPQQLQEQLQGVSNPDNKVTIHEDNNNKEVSPEDQVEAEPDKPEVPEKPEPELEPDLDDPRSPSFTGSVTPSSESSNSPEIPFPEIPAPSAPFDAKSTQTRVVVTSESSTQTLNNFAVTLMTASNLPPLSLTQEVPDVAL